VSSSGFLEQCLASNTANIARHGISIFGGQRQLSFTFLKRSVLSQCIDIAIAEESAI
jgi:hypothetical protein